MEQTIYLDSNITVFSSVINTYPIGCVSVLDALKMIKNGKYADKINVYREFKTRESKIMIPAFTPSGTFNKRSVSDIESYNGIVCLDLDKKDNMSVDLDEAVKTFQRSHSLIAYHKSTGGEGYAVYIQTDNINPDNHAVYCRSLMKEVEEHLGLISDRACTDVCRLRYFSYDENLYINEKQIKPYHVDIIKEKKEVSVSDCIDGFEAYVMKVAESSIDITEDYNDWYRIAFILADVLGARGSSYFHAISQNYVKYSYTQTEKLYNQALARNGSGSIADINTFYYICSKYGLKRKL